MIAAYHLAEEARSAGILTRAGCDPRARPRAAGFAGPGRNNWDMGVTKNFYLPWFNGERSKLQFRWETFNTFNHPQWNGVAVFCSSVTAPGEPCNGSNNVGNGEVAGACNPRIMHLGLRREF